MRVGVDLIEIGRIRAALDAARLPRARLHRGRAHLLRLAAESRAALRRPLRRQGGDRQGARLRRPLHLARDRDRRPAEARREPVRLDEGVERASRRGLDRPLDDALEGARRRDLRRGGRVSVEPLYTAAEMRAAEEAYAGPTLELMERAGAATAEVALERYPGAAHFTVWCGSGANGGDGFVVARHLAKAGREAEILLVGDEEKISGDAAEMLAQARKARIPVRRRAVVSGRGRGRDLRHGLLRCAAPRGGRAHRRDQAARDPGRRRWTCPRAWTPPRGSSPAPPSTPMSRSRSTGASSATRSGRGGTAAARSWWRTSDSPRRRTKNGPRDEGDPRRRSAARAARPQVQRRATSWSSAALRG